MTLAAGARLGPYEILAPLGAGGMGEVYRARDTRLERTVAVKVLSAAMSSSPEVRQRFEREAKTISKLSHPHICALYDVGREGQTDYLVMELLEGETLTERLAKGAVPVDQTLRYGQEIAGALDKAHRQGIVHRDLKPGNVMLTKSGVKLLDFGLAKGFEGPKEQGNLTSLPTRQGLTQEGTILGTFQYMAPEQLEGKDADARTDIFAFGATLYEMATGKKAFSGATQASLIGAILHMEPQSISAEQPASPPALDRIVRTCLAKDPEDRWQSAADIKRELRWIAEGSADGIAAPTAAGSMRRNRERLAWVLAVFALLSTMGLAFVHFREAPIEPRPVRFVVFPPDQTTHGGGPAAPQSAVSPDGRYLAFVATTLDRTSQLWVRPLESLAAQKLTGTEDASYPFWSPDSRFIGFFTPGKLKKVDVFGGPPQALCDAPDGNGGTWNRNGVIVFAPDRWGGLARVSATGGIPAAITALDRRRQETAHVWPQFLPDGRHFLYLVLSGRRENRGIYIHSLASENAGLVLRTEVRAAYTPPGYLLFVRQGTLMAQRFDPNRLQLTGEPVRVAEQVSYNPSNGRNTLTASENGVIAYRIGNTGGVPMSELVWFDREGNRIGPAAEAGLYVRPRLSPDGKRIAVQRRDPQTGTDDIWLVDLARSTVSRLTFDPSSQTHPTWSPDGSRIVFTSDQDGLSNLYQRLSSGAGGEELLLSSDTSKYVTDWSPDGRFIAYEEMGSGTGSDLWVLPLSGDRKPIPFLRTEFYEGQGQFSPDGRWMAYVSNESGRAEVYVQAFPASGGKWQISTAGGFFPRWRGDGKELFYRAADRKIMAVSVQADSTLRVGQPRALFEIRVSDVPVNPYTVSADGQRFLVNTPTEESNASPITVVLNWTAELKNK
jgi:Tol biopolymer transport system component